MKKKLMLAVLLSICIIFVVSANTVNAAPGFYHSTIVMAGVGSDGSQCIFQMTSPSWSGPKWFVTSTASSNKMLAVALTALSMEKTVWIVIDSSLAEWQTIQQFYAVP